MCQRARAEIARAELQYITTTSGRTADDFAIVVPIVLAYSVFPAAKRSVCWDDGSQR